MKNKLFTLALFANIALLLSLNGCSKIFNLGKSKSDESETATEFPLSVPPNFDLSSPKNNVTSTKKAQTNNKMSEDIKSNAN